MYELEKATSACTTLVSVVKAGSVDYIFVTFRIVRKVGKSVIKRNQQKYFQFKLLSFTVDTPRMNEFYYLRNWICTVVSGICLGFDEKPPERKQTDLEQWKYVTL